VIRRNPITGEPVILATKRAVRPNAFGGETEVDCPFCPGNESMTPPELARAGEPWQIRVFPNKYPATETHEIIVESPRHDATFEECDAFAAVTMYAQRYQAMKARYVSIFKNNGTRAGASIAHLHSQILGVPFVPPRVQREIDGFSRAASCPLCAPEGEIIEANDDFLWIAPRAAAVPYQQWIVPRGHAHEMAPSRTLAEMLQHAARASAAVASSFNWIFMNFPGAERAHWYVDVVPRVAALAGFEIGSGSGINMIDADMSADALRARP
jgi:UDPglucose--hexose-1-phosphate uridylyltransferase